MLFRSIPRSKKLRGSVVTLDGFTGFTPAQYQVIGELLRCCSRLTAAFTIDADRLESRGEDFFSLSRKTMAVLSKMAEETGAGREADVVLKEPVRFSGSGELAFLSKRLFQNGKETYEGETQELFLSEEASPAEEVRAMTGRLASLVREEGYRYREIAVVCGDMEGYRPLLVRAMEELGIGRPSTYAPTITTILARRYIVKENKNLYVTELGEVVNNMMKEAFPSIVDVNFTATMEALLDGVEEGNVKWKTVVKNFYPDLQEAVEKAEKELEEVELADELADEYCELCGRQMVIKYGPHGRFLACPGFPDCRNTKPYFEKIGVACPKCGKDIVLKKTKKGRKYYGCIDNPDCDFMVWQQPVDEKCDRCGSIMLKKGNKLVCSDETCGFVRDMPKEKAVQA